MAEAETARWRRWLASVRVRTAVGATLITGLALLVGALVLVSATRRTLTSEVAAVAQLRAFELAQAIEGSGGQLPVLTDEDELVQILDSSRRTLAVSPALIEQEPIEFDDSAQPQERTVPFEDDDFMVVNARADTPGAGGPYRVVVGLSLEEVADSVLVMRGLLGIGLPALMALMALIMWLVIGRTLAPVEAIRREVSAISASQLQRRVPVPGSHDEISHLASTMNRMLGRLENSQEQQRRFVSDASHELRSPVASIRQHAEVALAHPEVTDTARLAGTVLAESLRVQALVEDLLLLAKADEQTLAPASQPVDLDDIVFEEAKRVRAIAKVQVDTTGVGAGRVLGDPSQLRRAITNLADNAARHAASRVSFNLKEEDDGVVLRVDDDGPGIPTDERERIFERFVRLDRARDRDHGGSGLGLAIVTEIVRLHGGSVSAGDSPLGGTRMEVRLPGTE